MKNFNKNIKKEIKIIIIIILLLISISCVFYFHKFIKTGNVITHFFYIPSILAVFWFRKKGLLVSIFLALVLVFSHMYLRDINTLYDFYRAFAVILVSFFFYLINERVETANKNFVTLNKEYKAQNIELQRKEKQLGEINKKLESLVELRTNELKDTVEKLKNSNATKDKFFSIIAHDLKGPFNSILGFSGLLDENYEKYDIQKQKHFIKIINQSVKNTLKLLENLLLWSRSQRGILDYKPEKENIYLLYTETIKFLILPAEKKSISLRNEIPEDIVVKADKNMISTVMRNLISNAIKYTHKDGEIIVKARTIKDKNKQLFAEITVKDNGLGILPNLQAKLFKIEENISTEGTEKEQGTGLGLILCKEFVEKHGGEIWVKSELGKGSEFVFTIPVNGKFDYSL